jgi:hypothetical protein
MESCLKIGGEYWHGLGAHFYKMGKISTLSRATTQNTTTTHNNKNEWPPLTLWWLSPSVSMSRGDLPPPNHCAAVPLRVCAGREPSVMRSLAPVPLFGVPEWHPSKMREVGSASTLMAAIHFKHTTINK